MAAAMCLKVCFSKQCSFSQLVFAADGLLPCLQVYTILWKMPQDLISGSQRGISFCIYLPAKQPLIPCHSSLCRRAASCGAPPSLGKVLGTYFAWANGTALATVAAFSALLSSRMHLRSTSWDVAARVGNLQQQVATGASGARAASSSRALGLEVTPSLCSRRSALGMATSCVSRLCHL